jgi:hypothetical protein
MNANLENVTNQIVPETPVPIGPAQKACAKCGDMFVPPRFNPKKKFCGTLCKNRYSDEHPRRPRQLQRVEKVCAGCGIEFSVPKCFENQRFCGRSCSGKNRMILEVRQCKSCGSEFKVRPSDPKKFCKKQCVNTYLRGDKIHNWVEPSLRPCKHCGGMFDGYKGWQKSKKFCSKACALEGRRANGGPRSLPTGSVSQYADGYRYVKTERHNWIPEHRLIAEREIGRKIRRHELVHHKNGNRSDNRPENLQILSISQHMNIHHEAERVGLRVQAGELFVFTAEQFAAFTWIHPIEGMEC